MFCLTGKGNLVWMHTVLMDGENRSQLTDIC
uniref:Uncharacterized protein n=1 Tax=Arundo donax TaxID=35708 RepID=A0A0A8ZKA8_ARUDO